MKTTIRCVECTTASWKLHVGFAGTDELHCSERSCIVETDDGCTFGFPGTPGVAVNDYDVDIGDFAAVKGW